jgi:hypothetical protein
MNTAISAAHSEAAFYRNRQAMLMYPVIVLPFIAVLFWLFGGGKGEQYLALETSAIQPGARGFNASVPNAKSGSINGRDVETPGYGKAQAGQVLSTFTSLRRDSASSGLKAIPSPNSAASAPLTRASSLASAPVSTPAGSPGRLSARPNQAALLASRPTRPGRNGYYYNPPGKAYYSASATDQQLDQQLQQYERSQQVPAQPSQPVATAAPGGSSVQPVETKPATIRLSDNLTASRLSEAVEPESPFLTAPTGNSRTQPTRAVLSGGNYGQKKAIVWMIPVVVHEDQVIKDGQQVKLRLLKEVSADGITIPANTILYALCQLTDDRLRLTVNNLQLGGQLIPLDLDVYDTDGSPGINVPGLSQTSQVGGQMRSSAIQGINVPGIGGLGNSVINSARMGASQSVRQATIRLRAGYNLFLKAQ